MSAHESEWTLRRLSAGELAAAEAARVRAHAATCAACGATLRGIEKDQALFEAEVPFERFEAGVERAVQRQRRSESFRVPPRRWVATTVAMAASVLVVFLARPLLSPSMHGRLNRLKGGAVAELRIGGGLDPQREARIDAPEALARGERVMLGFRVEQLRYVAAVSVDAIGEVTPLHPESGQGLPVRPDPYMLWLPQSWELTGSGAERVVLVLSDEPLSVESVMDAARRAFQAADGDVEHMPLLDVPGEQTHWVLLKP
ncbi:zf-HC2 domain-containing protein [Myxococcus sp. RHSTA-1-4]|uniref:zf-HC2 domain-containing protein n=1 Tax=Myxococcus sp. RHSTA-1-4 TaxID=2874601 RepID=UPI001CBE77BD|nr:zf-HC2 domain-containing protein [Myxococcus sp. RHSTA-1-4]MBZ4422533.1 DUF4384 domain-containing protein [Myxococcus sp. RHSTA-1-4]